MTKKYFGSNHLYKAGLALATFLMVMGLALHLGNSELYSAQDVGSDTTYDEGRNFETIRIETRTGTNET